MKRKSETQFPLFFSVTKRPRSKIPRRCRISPLEVCKPSESEASCVTDDETLRSVEYSEVSSGSVVKEEGIGKSSDSNPFYGQSSVDFLNDVKKRFAGNPGVYKEIRKVIVYYRRKKVEIKQEEITNLCVEVVRYLFGHADMIHQFLGMFKGCEKLGRDVRRGCAFAIEDRMVEIEVLLSNFRTTIETMEDALRVPPSELIKFVENRFVGMKLMAFRRMYEEWSEVMIEGLRKDPLRGIPVVLVRLREKERALSLIRSATLQFLRHFNAVRCKH